MPLPPDRMRVAWLPPTQPGSVLTLASPPLAPKWLPPGPIDYVLAIGPDHLPRWVPPSGGGGGGGMANPMTDPADLIVGGASGTPTRLGVGADATVLTVVGGVPAWQAVPPSGMTNPMLGLGDVIYGGPTPPGVPTRLAPGSNGQFLMLSAGVPVWADMPPGFTNPMTSVGDVIVGGTAGAATRLEVGTAGQVLTVASGAPSWRTPILDPLVGAWTWNDALIASPPISTGQLGRNAAAGIGLDAVLKQYVASSGSFSFTAGPTTTAIVISSHAGSGNYRITAATYGGVALTSAGSHINGTAACVSMWYLLNPPLGTQTVTISFNGDGYVLVRSLTGVASFGALASATSGGNPLTTTIASAVGRFVIDAATKQNAGTTHTMTAGAGQTVHFQDGGVETGPAVLGSIKAGAASVTMTWTDSPGGGLWGAQQLLEVIPLAGTTLPPSMIVVSTTASDGSNHAFALGALKPGDSLIVQSYADAAKTFRVDVTGNAVVTGATVQIPVTPRSAAWGAYPANGDLVALTLDLGAGGFNPLTTSGDIIVGLSGGALGRLGIGTAGQVLTVGSGTPVWTTPFTNPMTGVGDLIRGGTAGAATRLAPGSNGQWLTLTGGIPAWAALPVDPGFANPMTTLGDLIQGGASGAPSRLGIGSTGQVLTVVSGAPAWQTLSALTNPMTTLGDLITGGASGTPGRLGIGTTGQVLTVVAGAPAWQSLSVLTVTREIELPIAAADAPDGTGGVTNVPATLVRRVSGGTQTGAAPKVTETVAHFNDTTNQTLCWSFVLPPDYVSGGTLIMTWSMASATTGQISVRLGCAISTVGTTDTRNQSFLSSDLPTNSLAVPSTLGRTAEYSSAFTVMTGAAPGKAIVVFVLLGPGATNATGNRILERLRFSYTAKVG